MAKANDESLDLIFRAARTHHGWQNKEVPDDLLQQIYDLCKWGPTSTNMSPMRVVFVKSKEAKEKLKPCLDEGNVEQTMAAPATAILGMDFHFWEQLPKLSPHNNAKSWFDKKPEEALQTPVLRNASLQGGYFILAARALGLDCGPMSGFKNAKVDEVFFAGTHIKSNFLCNLGYGNPEKLYPRGPRLTFDEACEIV